jgi:sugar transferase (PEP-CTERM system associated)
LFFSFLHFVAVLGTINGNTKHVLGQGSRSRISASHKRGAHRGSVHLIRVFSHWIPARTVVQVLFDLLLLFAIVIGAAWFDRGHAATVATVAPYALLFALLTTALNKLIGLYNLEGMRSVPHVAALAVLSFLVAAPVAYAIFDELPKQAFRDGVLQLAALLAVGGVAAIRMYAGRGGSGLMRRHRVMVLGTGPEAQAVEQSLRNGHFEIVGFYPVQGNQPNHIPPRRTLSSDTSLAVTTRRLMVDEIIVAVGDRRSGGMPLNDLLECKLAGVRVFDLSSYFERALGQVRLDSLRASWLIFGDGFRQGVMRTFVKRLFDIVVATALLVVATPIMLLTAIFIAVESGRPIFYHQERVGYAGQLFGVVKFRSMRVDAEGDGKPRWARSRDDRVTRVGRIIRKYRIDELPQLINVLRGNMSLVGPRPERPFFVDQLTTDIPFYAARHTVKPGLTGWAQVRYHYGATADDAANKLQFDLYYVKNHTLFLDLVVLFETIVVVATGQGAQ